jgi:hypothetical protein
MKKKALLSARLRASKHEAGGFRLAYARRWAKSGDTRLGGAGGTEAGLCGAEARGIKAAPGAESRRRAGSFLWLGALGSGACENRQRCARDKRGFMLGLELTSDL